MARPRGRIRGASWGSKGGAYGGAAGRGRYRARFSCFAGGRGVTLAELEKAGLALEFASEALRGGPEVWAAAASAVSSLTGLSVPTKLLLSWVLLATGRDSARVRFGSAPDPRGDLSECRGSRDMRVPGVLVCCANRHAPLQPAALAFVSYGFVLARVRVQP